MRQVWKSRSSLLWVAILAACGSDTDGSSHSAVAQNFDLLAREVTRCADAQATCSHKAVEAKAMQSCKTEYTACRSRAGKSAEDALVDAIADCQAQANDCRPEESKDVAEDRCEAALRVCIGEASDQRLGPSRRDASAPSERAPTYQCFGQLRVCIGDATGPKQCAAEARACVLAAVEPPAPRRLSTGDAGVND
jgi:hypothetical protein